MLNIAVINCQSFRGHVSISFNVKYRGVFLLPVNRTSLEGTGENGVNNGYELCSVLAPLHGMERQKEREGGGRGRREGEKRVGGRH